MKLIILFAIMIVITCCDAASAQKVDPCLLVCRPPNVLNPNKCSCDEPESAEKPTVCLLVCLGPDERLDALQCRCIKTQR